MPPVALGLIALHGLSDREAVAFLQHQLRPIEFFHTIDQLAGERTLE